MPDHVRSAKEIFRYLLYRTGGTTALLRIKGVREPTGHLSASTLEGRFATIHRDRVWSINGSVSGPGSDGRATGAVQIELERLLRELGATRVTDIGCGDFGLLQPSRILGARSVADLPIAVPTAASL